MRSYRNYPWDCVLRYKDSGSAATNSSGSDPDQEKMNTVAYVARMSKDTKCYTEPGGSQAKLFPQIKKDAVVDVMKYTKKIVKARHGILSGFHIRQKGLVFEFVPSGTFRHLK